MKAKRILTVAAAAALIITSVFAGGNFTKVQAKDNDTPKKITLGYWESPNGELLTKEKGSLEAAFPDTDVEWVEFQSGTDILTAMQSGSIDFATIGTPPAALGLAKGYPFNVSDHGLLVGENVPPILGEYGGLNLGVMEELGYTVRKKDENGDPVDEIDWEKTRAVQIRSNYIYINLKGRDKYGIVEAKDKYDLEEQIISDLYSYRDKATGKRVVGIAMRNKDSVVLGLGGAECGDIIFTINEGFNRLHGDGLSTAEGYAQTSVTPVFLAAGEDIKEGKITDRVIRQVDVAPTIAEILDVRKPEQCEGAPVYQILKK